jgi:hypothetical protein
LIIFLGAVCILMVGSYKNKHIVVAMCFRKEIKKGFYFR